MKVLISDNLSPVGVEILKKAGLEVDARSKTSVEEIEKIIGEYDALIIRSATKVTAGLLEKATKLKVVGRAGSGLDNVDIPAATQKGGVVANGEIGLGMKVLAYDPFISTEKAKSLGIELADLETIYKKSDFITVHTPKTKETANLINKNTISRMRDGVRIINYPH